MLNQIKYHLKGAILSYGQILFSNHLILSITLILVSFLDPTIGAHGFLCILSSQLAARLFNFDPKGIEDGSYTFNSLLTGLAIGSMFQNGSSSIALSVLAGFLCFFITIWYLRSFAIKSLPYLSIPFLVTVWTLLLGAKNFSALNLQEHTSQHPPFISVAINYSNEFISSLPLSDFLHIYLRSLGALFFQYNDLAGILIVLALLYSSRISFLLSLYGFAIGFGFYQLFQGDFTHLIYSYVGFNFILTSIALGGFFIVPNTRSFILLLFVIPVIALTTNALQNLFLQFGLPIYSLPFNTGVFMTLAALAYRSYSNGLELVVIQQNSPEENHYKFIHHSERFKSQQFLNFSLPVIGEWYISQGHAGNITHKGDWQYAWDFDVRDEVGHTFKADGLHVSDYYCYELPVLAPADGWVIAIQDGIDDNEIGELDYWKNWGNSIVIKHAEFLYTKLSHLKKSTFLVKEGEYVYRGQIIGYCGSSGRSPEPHLHFQIQATPFIGSKTLKYPIGYYITRKDKDKHINFFDIPKEGEWVSNVLPYKILTDTYSLIPGRKMEWIIKEGKKSHTQRWEVFTDAFNLTYIYCHSTHSIAYFVNNGIVFYFTDFKGDYNSALFHFFSASQKVLLGYYNQAKITEPLLPNYHFNKALKWLHDFTAPFFHYCKSSYTFKFKSVDNEHNPESLVFTGTIQNRILGKILSTLEYTIEIENKGFSKILLKANNSPKVELICIS